MYLDIYKNIYISIIMERYIYVMIHETDFRKNISIIQTIGTKYLPLVQIQFFKCIIFWFPYVGSILLGSTM